MLFNNHNNYSEGISVGHVFVLTDDQNIPKNQPCWCKDYFQDYFWMIKTQKDFGKIHGYSHPVEKEAPYYKYHIKFGAKSDVTSENTYKYYNPPHAAFIKIRMFLLNIAKNLKLSKPIVTVGKENEGDIIIQFNSDWYKYPYLHSFFTSAIRIGTYISYQDFIKYDRNNLKTLEKHRVTDLSNSYDNIRSKYLKFLKSGLPVKDWNSYTPSNVHSSSGIQSLNI